MSPMGRMGRPPPAIVPPHLRCDVPTALFGGTFDPVHAGHLGVAQALLASGRVRQVLFVPAGAPPHKLGRPLTDARHRLAMLALAVGADPRLGVSPCELERAGPSYTLHTARHFREVFGPRLRLVLGADSLRDLHLWYEAATLVRENRFLVYRRPGCRLPAAATLRRQFGAAGAAKLRAGVVRGPRFAVSSSALRAALAAGNAPATLLPPAVHAYITANRLYETGSPPPATKGEKWTARQ